MKTATVKNLVLQKRARIAKPRRSLLGYMLKAKQQRRTDKNARNVSRAVFDTNTRDLPKIFFPCFEAVIKGKSVEVGGYLTARAAIGNPGKPHEQRNIVRVDKIGNRAFRTVIA